MMMEMHIYKRIHTQHRYVCNHSGYTAYDFYERTKKKNGKKTHNARRKI